MIGPTTTALRLGPNISVTVGPIYFDTAGAPLLIQRILFDASPEERERAWRERGLPGVR